MNVLAVCAGIAGLELGIHAAHPGATTVCYVEREAHAASLLAARMEDGWLDPAPIWTDLSTFDAEPWRGKIHCIASGDPCQPNSVAGSRRGADDDRWLIDQLLHLVDRLRPGRLFRENVPGNADGQLDALVPALERMGYRVAAGIFSAAEVGASHRRERLFLMADQQGRGCGELGDAPGQGRGGHADGGDAALADSQCAKRWPVDSARGDPGQHGLPPGTEGPGGLGVGGEDVAHGHGHRQPAGPGFQRGPERPGREHGDDAQRCDCSMANAHGERGQQIPGSAQGDEAAHGRTRRDRGEPDGGHQPERHGQGAADAGETGLPAPEQLGEPTAPECGFQPGTATPEFPGGALPLFAPGPGDPRWPEIIVRWPAVEPAVGKDFPQSLFRGMAYELACRLDGDLFDESEERRPSEILCRMWEAVVAQTYWWATGRPWCVYEAAILRCFMYGKRPKEGGCFQVSVTEAIRFFQEECLRNLWNLKIFAASSQGQGLAEQQCEQSADALRTLSHESSSLTWRHCDEEAEAAMQDLWKAFLSNIRAALQHLSDQETAWKSERQRRTDRLRATGNAVAPLQAAYAWRTLEATLAGERDG